MQWWKREDEGVEEETVGGAGGEGVEGEEYEDDEASGMDELLDVTSELDYGLLCGVVGMSVVDWLRRLKDRLDQWEVEAMAVQHVAI